MFKYDLHCHTKEGSIDAKLSVIKFAMMLKKIGFSGMLVSDHNSFKGYEYYEKRRKAGTLPEYLSDFVVLKGIEYDSRDGGHCLCILPDGAEEGLIAVRGMGVRRLIKEVHKKGGIIGAAHPFGTGYFALTNTHIFKKHPTILKEFDFVETYNSGLPYSENLLARILARSASKPETSGSDAHEDVRVGSAFTSFRYPIRSNDDLIHAIRNHAKTSVRGRIHANMFKKPRPIMRQLGIYGYWVYNKTAALLYTVHRLIVRFR